MDNLDRQIITELQENFPLASNPYQVLADKIGITIDQLWTRVVALVESGVIRRIGFSIDSRKIGYSSTLAAIRVSQNRIQEACVVISRYPQITHSYLREDQFNIWFTVIAENRDAINNILGKIRDELALSESDMMDLPVIKLFKLDARFK